MGMSQEQWAEFRHDTKKDLDELFSRMRSIESKEAVYQIKDENLSEKMDNLMNFFEKHDTEEMKKYQSMSTDITKIVRFMYLVTGAFALLSFVGFDNLRRMLIG